MPPIREAWENHKQAIKIILTVLAVTGGLLSSVISFVWAVSDKTMLWGRLDIASTQSVDDVKSTLSSTITRLEVAITEVKSTNQQLSTMVNVLNNGIIIDRWTQILDSPRFTDHDKAVIKDGVFIRKTITADSLSTLLRDK